MENLHEKKIGSDGPHDAFDRNLYRKAFEHLKSALFADGYDAISDFLGYDYNSNEDKDVIDRWMDMAYDEMSYSELSYFFKKYGIRDDAVSD